MVEQLWLRGGRIVRPFSLQARVNCRGVSQPARRAICDFASEKAYRRACSQMLEHYRLEIPVSLAVKCCMQTGEELRLGEPSDPVAALPAHGADILVLEADGTMTPVILQQSESGDRRKGKKLGYKEMRLLAAQDLDKAQAVYAAGFYEVEQAGAAWSRCAASAGWSMSTLTHAPVDGAGWIRLQHDIHFARFGRALSDCYHVCEYLSAAFPDPADFQLHKGLLLQERVEDTLIALGDLADKEDPGLQDQPAASALRYLNNRYDSLFYAQALDMGLPIGSGLIESGHRHVLQARIKLAGAWWKPVNADRMAKIRAVKANGLWESLWQRGAA